jgi:UDP-N-acetyl-L-fucosamine synthase
MNKLKIMTVVGTRPEIIRLSATIKLLDKYTNQIFVHTGQNYDYELNEIFFEDLGLRKPDHFMNVDTSSLGTAVGDIFKKTEEIINLEKPDALLVLGDTNSCLSAYMAKRKHIPIFHMEAGNRSYDFNVPEEINRRIIDHIADFNLVYTEHARRHLISEGLQHRRIYLTGSPMFEVLQQNMEKIQNSNILERLSVQIHEEGAKRLNNDSEINLSVSEEKNPRKSVQSASSAFPLLEAKKYFMVSVHREENVDNPDNLKKILTVLNTLAEQYQLPVIVSTHPRTRKRIENLRESAKSKTYSTENKISEEGAKRLNDQPEILLSYGEEKNPRKSVQSASSAFHLNPLIHFMKPFGFTDYVHLQMNALCTISDSGTISEESAMLNFPAISLRQSMERPEAQDAGSIILTGFEPDVVLNAIATVIEEFKDKRQKYKDKSEVINNENSESSFVFDLLSFVFDKSYPQEYFIPNTSWRVVKLILGNTKLSNKWWGINE